MIIAIHIKSGSLEENGFTDNFIEETFRRIIPRHPEHNFVLISGGENVDVFKGYTNVINVVKKPIKQSATQWYIWFNIKLPSILKKYKADIFVSYGSIASLRTKVPQYLIVPDLAFLHEPGLFKKKHILFLKTIVPRSLKRAKLVVTVSEYCKADIVKQYKIKPEKIAVVYKGIDESYKPLSLEKREVVKANYTNGNEYFIYCGEIGFRKNLQNLLRAFSAFKKRQKSNMQLLIAGLSGTKYEEFAKTLSLFRFKDDVKVLENISPEELVKVTAASYCFIYPSIYETFATPQLQAMKCLLPVITSSVSAMPEICDTAALYTDPDSFKDIAIKMMMIFKDENLRKSLIEKGKARVHKYNWEITSGLLWKSLEKFLN